MTVILQYISLHAEPIKVFHSDAYPLKFQFIRAFIPIYWRTNGRSMHPVTSPSTN